MQLGSFSIELLSEGRFEMFHDGHINRSSTEEDDPLANEVASSIQSAIVGINPILIKTEQQNVLIDTGLGWGLDAGSQYTNVSNVKTNLEIFRLRPDDITHVILSHLHYDHVAGSSFTNSNSETKATFPNAAYFVHQREWKFALSQVGEEQPTPGANYKLDDFYRLVADDRIEFLEGNENEIVPGISTICTGGHTPGHQAVMINSDGDLAYFLGDLLPSSSHLNHYNMSGLDTDPIQAKKKKIQLLRKVCDEKGILLFYHSKYGQSGRLIQNKDKQYALTEITRS